MTDVEFVIPTNKDELLQGEPGQYSVTNVCSLPELSHKLAGKICLYTLSYSICCTLTVFFVILVYRLLQFCHIIQPSRYANSWITNTFIIQLPHVLTISAFFRDTILILQEVPTDFYVYFKCGI